MANAFHAHLHVSRKDESRRGGVSDADFPLQDRDTGPGAAAAFDRAEAAFGMIPNLTRKMATSPALAQAYMEL